MLGSKTMEEVEEERAKAREAGGGRPQEAQRIYA